MLLQHKKKSCLKFGFPFVTGMLVMGLVFSSLPAFSRSLPQQKKKKKPIEFEIPKEPAEDKPPQPVVPPTEGHLALVTTRDAQVVLKNARGVKVYSEKVGERGVVKWSTRTPGRYVVEITRPDFESLTQTVAITKGKQESLVRFLTSKYGDVTFSMPGQAAPDVQVELNGKTVELSRLKVEDGKLLLARVPVGEHTIKLKKPRYDDLEIKRVVLPGQCDNFVSIRLIRPSVTLTVVSEPNAEVYVEGQRRGVIEPTRRELVIPDLEAGEAELFIKLDGYESETKLIPLTLDKNAGPVTAVKFSVPLTPIVEDADFTEEFDSRLKNWKPFPPPGWKFQTEAPIGMTLTGTAAGFVFNTTRPNRKLNFYRDFDLTMNVRFLKGNGFAWIIRAKDENNYYLFELDKQRSQLLFYICENGVKRPLRTDAFTANLDDPEWFYPIKLTVRGNKFSHTIETPVGIKRLGGDFEDSTFSLGGVGLQAIDGAEVFLNQFLISKPEKKP